MEKVSIEVDAVFAHARARAHRAGRKCDAKSRAGETPGIRMPSVRRADRRRAFPKYPLRFPLPFRLRRMGEGRAQKPVGEGSAGVFSK